MAPAMYGSLGGVDTSVVNSDTDGAVLRYIILSNAKYEMILRTGTGTSDRETVQLESRAANS